LTGNPQLNKVLNMKRVDGRSNDQLRKIKVVKDYLSHPLSSVMIEAGGTKLICAVSLDPKVPPWMKAQKVSGGWVTCEYGMLPASTHERMKREASSGKQECAQWPPRCAKMSPAVSVGIVNGERCWIFAMKKIPPRSGYECRYDRIRQFVEVQGTAEGQPFDRKQLDELLALADAAEKDI
jgi:ribonuclease PH